MGYKVLLPQDVSAPGKDYLLERGYEIEVLDDFTVENICAHVADADAILLRTALCSEQVFAAAKKLKVVARHGVGLDNIDLKAAAAYGVKVTYAPVSNSNSVAEHTVMMMLACAKNLILQDRACRAGNYISRNLVKGVELEGKTVGVIGCGHIGQLVAAKAHFGFGMNVVAYDAYADPAKLPEYISLRDSVDEVYAEADFITYHVPLNEETHWMAGRDAFTKMKKGAFVINCARGGIVNEDDLYEAIISGQIGGAGLDVFESETLDPDHPLDPANPLYTLDRVIVSPHDAALTFEAADRMGLHAAIGIDEVLSGKEPTWPVRLPG